MTLGGVNTYGGATTITGNSTLQVAPSPLAVSPIVRYTLDGTIGTTVPNGTTIPDASNHGNDAQMMINWPATFVPSPVGQGLSMPASFVLGPHLDLRAWTTSQWIDIPAMYNSQGEHSLVTGRYDSAGGFDLSYIDPGWGKLALVPRFGSGAPTAIG